MKKAYELFPAALLSQRHRWQEAAQALPAGSYLLVTDPDNVSQAEFMQKLVRLCREKGRQIVIWTIKHKQG